MKPLPVRVPPALCTEESLTRRCFFFPALLKEPASRSTPARISFRRSQPRPLGSPVRAGKAPRSLALVASSRSFSERRRFPRRELLEAPRVRKAHFPPGVLSGRERKRTTAAPGSGPTTSNPARQPASGSPSQPPVVVGAPPDRREGGAGRGGQSGSAPAAVTPAARGEARARRCFSLRREGGGAAQGARGGFVARERARRVCGLRNGAWPDGALGGHGPRCACW